MARWRPGGRGSRGRGPGRSRWRTASGRPYGDCNQFDWDFLIAEEDYDNGLKVLSPTAIDKPIPFARAVEPSFVKKAQARFAS